MIYLWVVHTYHNDIIVHTFGMRMNHDIQMKRRGEEERETKTRDHAPLKVKSDLELRNSNHYR